MAKPTKEITGPDIDYVLGMIQQSTKYFNTTLKFLIVLQ